MVRLFFLLLLALPVVPALAVTADQLREMSENKSSEEMQRNNRVNTGSMGDLVPGKPAPRSNKYGGAPAARKAARTDKAAADAGSPKSDAAKPTGGDASNIYIPPVRGAGSAGGSTGFTSDAVKPSQTFGIRLGSWISASLTRNTSSAESGTVELSIADSYAGDRRTLPAGTTVFAEKSLNGTTKRMEMVVTHGITPDGKEFVMRGLVFDPQKMPGLAGIFVIDKKQVVTSGAAKGTIAAVGAIAGQMTSAGGPGAAAANAATQSVLNDTSQASEFNNSQQAVIYVSPQPLLIRVEKQF